MATAQATPATPPKPLPEANGDFYQIGGTLTAEEQAIRMKVRSFMEKEVQPIINDYWERDEFPFDLVPKIRQLGIMGSSFEGYGCPGGRTTMMGVIMLEMARVDCSMSTFFGVHSGLSMGSIYLCGSEA